MAKIKIKFRASSSRRGGELMYQVTHNRVSKLISTGYFLFPDEWDKKVMDINYSRVTDVDRHSYLLSIGDKIQVDLDRLDAIVSRFERVGMLYTSEDVARRYLSQDEYCCFLAFARNLIKRLEGIGKKSVAYHYYSAIRSFSKFWQNDKLYFEEFTSDLMVAYEAYLLDRDICPNTTSFYMRNLRAIYNRAVEKDLTIQRFPFKRVYTGVDKTVKRAVSLDIIRRIYALDLRDKPTLEYARDMFMFSFYMRGMSFVDLAFLKKKDLMGDVLTYRRRKTNQLMVVKWEKPMQDLVDKYGIPDSPYMLPIIRDLNKDVRLQYLSTEHRVNMYLKKVGELLDLSTPLTTYVARHSWASIARGNNVPISTISEAMGHTSEAVTRIYLASLDHSLVDNANSAILNLL